MLGVDLSASSLRKPERSLPPGGPSRRIPLPDASIDAAVRSFVQEHILPDQSPSARLAFLYDVESRQPDSSLA